MGLFSKPETDQAVAAYKKARAELERVSRRDRTESDDYLAANARVGETAVRLPWWRR